MDLGIGQIMRLEITFYGPSLFPWLSPALIICPTEIGNISNHFLLSVIPPGKLTVYKLIAKYFSSLNKSRKK